MPQIGNYDELLRVRVDKALKQKIKEAADRRGESISDYCRRICEAAIESDHATEGLDAILPAMRRVVKDQNRTFEDRFAAMIYKDTVASATAMNLLLLLSEKMGHDALQMYHSAQLKAVSFASNPIRDKK